MKSSEDKLDYIKLRLEVFVRALSEITAIEPEDSAEAGHDAALLMVIGEINKILEEV